MYGVTAMVFFVVGGFEALLIRAQLAGPDGTILSADATTRCSRCTPPPWCSCS
jgi:heme/copper-type cytochrome/quinol oxidase subunit 1